MLFIPALLFAQDKQKAGLHYLKDPDRWFRPDGINSVSDRALGLADKGELSNIFTNYGVLSNFHLGSPALHWPRSGSDVQHYGFGVSFMMIADDNIITSVYDQSSAALDFGWEACDGSLGLYYNDVRNDFNTAGDGITPFMAFSDMRDTWPIINGTPTWPGYYRDNLQNPGNSVPGEFTSDRDIFCVLQDDYGMGLRVDQTVYCYGRYYAEDLIFIKYRLFNEGSADYDSCYIGFQADLKPDFYADDYIQHWTFDEYNENPAFFYKWDHNGVAQRDDSSHFEDLWEGPVGYIGMGMIESPNDMGVTSFHYYHDDWSPTDDQYFAAMLKNDDASPLPNIDEYFHGSDTAFDDPALWNEVDNNSLPGTEITFTFGSGPFQLSAGDSVDFSIVFAIGEDSTDLRLNASTAYYMGNDLSYQGSGPPLTPILTATAGDGVVNLFWDNRAESSIDPINCTMDFEGYKLYKSENFGDTWGDPVTNYYGDIIGWIPIAQCDLVDSLTGIDPAYGPDFPNANKWLGDDTGIFHAFTDSNVVNGQEVWYCVTAYDKGVFDPTDPSLTEPSYENVLGVSEYEVNVIAAVPHTQSSNITPGSTPMPVEQEGKIADGQLEVIIVDPGKLLDHTYEITFNDFGDTVIVAEDTTYQPTLNLEDITDSTFQFIDAITGEEFTYQNISLTGDDLPIVNGFRLFAKNVEGFGVNQIGWQTPSGSSDPDSVTTFDWWTENRHPGNNQSYEEIVIGLDDWRITITEDSILCPVIAGGFGYEAGDSAVWVNLKVERSVYDSGGVWVDATDHLLISDLILAFGSIPSLGPYGWDLIPGGAAYNPNGDLGTLWPDMLILRDDEVDTTGSEVWIKTQNGPADAIPPSVGDVFALITFKPFNSGMVYRFDTQAPIINDATEDVLSRVKVVPNPLIVSSGLESNPYESKVMFTHLPAECDIAIYTVSANRVVTLHHKSESGEGYKFWDIKNHQGMNVAYGVYIYVIKTPNGKSTTGKLMVIR